jgi:hypothetical protein
MAYLDYVRIAKMKYLQRNNMSNENKDALLFLSAILTALIYTYVYLLD